MNIPPIRRRMLAVLAILVPLAGIFVVSVFRTGPFAPVSVRIDTIERKALTPTLSGIGTVEARWRYRIGPTRTGRLAELSVDVGDRVAASQTLGAMDPIDLDDRLAAQSATALSLESSIKMAESRLHETQSLQTYARSQHRRHLDLVKTGGVSVEAAEAASQREEAATASVASATAAVQLARSELAAARANLEAL
ncbi:MAG: efflux transporter periplasmic adaptor subunit, partial [Verrucomicrobiae bacterium]|nr:efflux transporter periplasmic adaptor subunit [Verrucomicrobiae bacterium]